MNTNSTPLSASRFKHRRSRAATGLALVALLVALLAARVVTASRIDNIARDGCIYLRMARDLTERPGVEVLRSYKYHPGYSSVVAFFAQGLRVDWPGGWIQVGQGVSIGFSLLGLIGIYLIARRAFDTRLAWVTVLLAGLSARWMEVSCDVISDAMAVSLSVLGIALGLEARNAIRRRSRWSLVFAGGAALAASGAYLTRPEGLLAAPVATALLLRVRKGPAQRGQRSLQAGAMALLIGLTLACCLPYMVAIGGISMKKGLSDFAFMEGGWPLAFATIPGDLFRALGQTLDRFQAAAGPPLTILYACCLATWVGRGWLGLKLPRRVMISPRNTPAMVAMFVPIAVLLPLLAGLEYNLGSPDDGYISSRHMLLPALMLSPLAAAAVGIFVQWSLHFAGRLGLKERPRLAWACWLTGVTCILAVKAFPVLHEGKHCHIRAGQAVAQQFGTGQCVLAPSAWTPFYSEAHGRQFEQVNQPRVVIRSQHLTSREALMRFLRQDRPGDETLLAVTLGLLESTNHPQQTLQRLQRNPQLKLLGVFRSSPKDKIWLFHWQPPDRNPGEPSGDD